MDQQTDSLGITTTVLPALSSVSRDADALFKLLRAHYGVDDVELTALMGGSAGSDTEAAHARLYERAKGTSEHRRCAVEPAEALMGQLGACGCAVCLSVIASHCLPLVMRATISLTPRRPAAQSPRGA